MATCMSIMPFCDGFEDIDRIIESAVQDCGLEYVRGDRRHQPGSVLPQILRDIQQAAIVVADITGHNPNVFYELGIAHQLKGPERVVIITQTPNRSPYDVNEFRQLAYTHSDQGRADLREKLPAYLRLAAAADGDDEVWNVVRGRLPRTRLLVRDLQRFVAMLESGEIEETTIRIIAGLGSLAISDHEPHDPILGADYLHSLLAERNSLRDALLKGARLRGVLSPPRRFSRSMLPERLRIRYRRLLGLARGRSDITDNKEAAAADIAAMAQCKFTLTPVPMPNLFIIGDTVAYEGMKRGGKAGFELTHCETSASGVQDLIRDFDGFFEDSYEEMKRNHPPDGQLAEQLDSFFREAGKGLQKGRTDD